MTEMVHGTYDAEDVMFLLRPLQMEYTSVEEKESLIQSGARHYSEMLSAESPPDAQQLSAFYTAIADNAQRVAEQIWRLARALSLQPRREQLALVSLARAGTPVGILLRRALTRMGTPVSHYSVSIARDRGLDPAALKYVLQRHYQDDIVFVDGWTGKGAIATELQHHTRGSRGLGVDPYLVVLADPAGRADLAATGEDYLIPSGILNGVVSGCLSRTIIPADQSPDQFHGVKMLEELRPHCVSRAYVDCVAGYFEQQNPTARPAKWVEGDRAPLRAGLADLLTAISANAGVTNLNNIKPGVAEATRAVLRRVPDIVYVADRKDPDLRSILHLCAKAGVEPRMMPIQSHFKAVTVIKGNTAE